MNPNQTDHPLSLISAYSVVDLASELMKHDLLATGPPAVTWGETVSEAELYKAIDQGLAHMPVPYIHAYVEPLRKTIPRMVKIMKDQGGLDPALSLCGAISDHSPSGEVDMQLRRFNAVIANYYRTFLSKERRSALSLPLIESLPPIATFRSSPMMGPFTYSADSVRAMTGASISVVSLPSAYRDLPILWITLAHETGGHDIIHADPGLLDEMKSNVKAMFGNAAQVWTYSGNADHAHTLSQLGLVWSYWINEAAADVFAILNSGPAFILNLSAWLSTWLSQLKITEFPRIRTSTKSINNGPLDSHPTDILRIYLAIGVIENLRNLDQRVRAIYIRFLLELVSKLCRADTEVSVVGSIPGAPNSQSHKIDITTSLDIAGDAARMVGRLMSGCRFSALFGRTVQDIETWSSSDEHLCLHMSGAFATGHSIDHRSSPRFLLAAATMAILEDTQRFSMVSERLAEALDVCVSKDPLWGTPAHPNPHSPYRHEGPVFKKVLQ